jgi:LCP family protein required for cell wall assembly
MVALGLIGVLLIGSALAAGRLWSFVSAVTNRSIFATVAQAVDPPAGSVAWKLRHNQQVNLLLLGYGGAENDAPYLTDSIMAVSVDPVTHRVMEASIPRDLWVQINAWPTGARSRNHYGKINEAYEDGVAKDSTKLARYQGRDGGGYLAEDTVGAVTGLKFDGYIGVDFAAFRDLVNALGGVTICLDGPLIDHQYPRFHGYMTINFAAGCHAYNGEQALEIARSRHAIEADQASDFGRARRQQAILSAIRKQALSVNGIARAPQLLSALQQNFTTDLSLGDMSALYSVAGTVADSAIEHVALTDSDLLDGQFQQQDSCGPYYVYVLCPEDPTYGTIHTYFRNVFVPRDALAAKIPVQIANASYNSTQLGDRVTAILKPLGLTLAPQFRHYYAAHGYIVDHTGGKDPALIEWLQRFFGLPVVTSDPNAASGEQTTGVVVVLGRDYARSWFGLS